MGEESQSGSRSFLALHPIGGIMLGAFSGMLGDFSGMLGGFSGMLGGFNGLLGGFNGLLGGFSGLLGRPVVNCGIDIHVALFFICQL